MRRGPDANGTGCRAAMTDADVRVLGRAECGPAHIRTGPPGSHRSIERAGANAVVRPKLPGDPGSGAYLCRKLPEEVPLAYDHGRPGSGLTCNLVDMFEDDSRIMVDSASKVPPACHARSAPMLIIADEFGDPIASEVLAGGCGDVDPMLAALTDGSGEKPCRLGGPASTYAERIDRPAGRSAMRRASRSQMACGLGIDPAEPANE